MTKIKLYFIFFIALLISGAIIYETYALLETNVDTEVDTDIGKWVVKVNDNLLSGEKKKLVINNFKYAASTTVDDGFIAPGRNGYADVILDTTGTEVAVRVDLTFDEDAIENENITYDVTLPDGTVLTRTDESTYTKVIGLSDMGTNITLRVSLIWENQEEYDESDSELGLQYDTKLVVPVDIKVTQYLGEEIREYQE